MTYTNYDSLTAIGSLFSMGLSRNEISNMGFSEESIEVAEDFLSSNTSISEIDDIEIAN